MIAGIDRVETFRLPMNVRFRGVEQREGMLVYGAAGAGEFSPFWDYSVAESTPWLAAAVEAATQPYPEPVRWSVPVNATVPAVGPSRAAERVLRSGGCRTAKVKVAEPGQSLRDDVDRVAAVRDALDSRGRIRIDANGGWDVDQAVAAIKRLAVFDLEYVEQPVARVEDLARVRRQVSVPIAADESIRRVGDPMRVRDLEAADIAVIKVQPLGGVRACLRLAADLGLPVVVSSALESSVGISAGLALAAALPDLPYACGLATTSMFTQDLATPGLRVIDGVLPAGRQDPDDVLVRAAAPDATTRDRWERRLARCADELAAMS